MANERGQRTRLMFGGVSAEVSLLATSGKAVEAQHETKRVLAEPASTPDPRAPHAQTGSKPSAVVRDEFRDIPVEVIDAAAEIVAGDPVKAGGVVGVAVGASKDVEIPVVDPETLEPTGETETAHVVEVATSGTIARPDQPDLMKALEESFSGAQPLAGDDPDPMGGDPLPAPATPAARAGLGSVPKFPPLQVQPGETVPMAAKRIAADLPKVEQEYVPPATTVQQGVHTETGEWLDLTEQLATIDQRTKVDGMEVIRTIGVNSIPREYVRDAKYIAGVNPSEYKVLSLLWRSLRWAHRAAAVRVTKRTQTVLGIIVARGKLDSEKDPAHLLLLELEWSENMRAPSSRVTGPVSRDVTDDELDAAVSLVNSFAGGPSAVFDLRDERVAKRRELLELARDGRLAEYVPPAERLRVSDYDGELGDAALMRAVAAWNREHAER